jgi:K+-transporting ATPase KdpF subunit
MAWEDILGIAISVGLLYYLFRAMIRAEKD